MGLDINLNTSKIDISEEDGLNVDLYNDNIDISDDEADDIIIEITGLKSLNKFIGLEDTPLYYDNGKFFKVEDNKIIYTDIEWKDISGNLEDAPEIFDLIKELVKKINEEVIHDYINQHNDSQFAHPYIQNIIQENYNILDTKINDTKEELSEALNTEIINRETADNELSENIQQETISRIESDTTLQNNIDALTNNLNTEIENRTNADNLLRDDINNISGELAQEILNRQTQDNLLQEQITSNYNTLDDKIDTEISNRTTADTALQNNIDTEALARQNADAVLQNNINTLSQTVTDNNTAINNRVDGVVSAFDDEIETINTNLSDLSDTVSNNYTDLDSKISDLTTTVNDNDTAINNKVDEINTTLTTSINNLSNTVSSNYTTLDTKIDNTKISLEGDISDLSDTVTNNYNTLDARITANADNITINTDSITNINSKIPNQASSSNQLADKDFVNSSIATNTATFRGTYNSIVELEAYSGEKDNNDYAFVTGVDILGNTYYDNYVYNGTAWTYRYRLNNSSFTAVQWASINSGATNTNIGQITINANNIADLQTNKQDVLTAGANVQINNNVISATDTIYTAGTGISIVDGVISNTQTSATWGNITGTLSNQTDLQNALNNKYDATNPDGYISGITSSDVISALGYTPYDSSNPAGYTSNVGTVTSVNNIQPDTNGNVTITIPDTATWGNITGTLSNQTDLQNALNAKYDASNPDGFISGIDSTDVTIALGYTPYNATNPDGFISGITSSDVTTALGYTPYNATNPDGFISSASVSSLTDVNLTSVANNQALLYNSTTQKWENKDVKITVDSALDSTSTNPVENRVIAQAIEDITLAKNPNLNLIGGNLNIDHGNVSEFSTTDYMQFPFVFNFNNYHWTLEMGFTTGSAVTTQQNILDSYYGIAFAIRNGKFVLAISSNGSSWDIANTEGTYSVQTNTAYSVKISWDGTKYTLSYALDETNYTTDITVASALVHHSTQEYVGGEPDLYGSGQHPFAGTINLNNWKLTVNNLEVWLGMDDVGLGSRANIDLSNLTEAGIEVIKSSVATDDITVSKNSDDELQAIGVIDDNSKNAYNFTVVGIPTITDDGIASGLSDGQLIFYQNLEFGKKYKIIQNLTVGELTSNTQVPLRLETTDGTFLCNFEFNSALTNLKIANKSVTFPALQLNDNIVLIADLSGNDLSVSLIVGANTYNITTSIANYAIAKIMTRPISTYNWSGSIDLKQFSITLDGVEVYRAWQPPALKTWTGTKAQYDAIVTKDNNTLYWVTDSKIIYLGDNVVGNFSRGRNVGEIITSSLPLTDAGLHLLDGTRLPGGGIYKGFVDYMAKLYNDTKVYNPSAFTVVGSPTITADGIASGFSATNRVTMTNLTDIAPVTKTRVIKIRHIWKTGDNATQPIVQGSNGRIMYTSTYGGIEIRDSQNVVVNTNITYKATDGDILDFIITLNTDKSVNIKLIVNNANTYTANAITTNDFITNAIVLGFFYGTYLNYGSIDLKQLSITVDGVEVFSGSKPANYFTDETTWQQSITDYGSCGKFVYDSTLNTVRLPKVSDILQGTTDIKALGDLVVSGLPQHTHTRGSMNITGRITSRGQGQGGQGAIYESGSGSSRYRLEDGSAQYWSFDASRSWTGNTSNANYTSTTATTSKVQPQTIKCFVYIVIATSAKTDIQVNIDNIATDLNGKADRDGSNMVNSVKNFDGQWTSSSLQIANSVTWATNTAEATYSLANYLPNDNYNYEVLITGMAITGTTSGNYVTIGLNSDLIDDGGIISVCEARTRTTSSIENRGSVIIPIGTGRYIKQYSTSSSNANGTYSLWVLGYRRIGTNE